MVNQKAKVLSRQRELLGSPRNDPTYHLNRLTSLTGNEILKYL